jgi:hypothetical protein
MTVTSLFGSAFFAARAAANAEARSGYGPRRAPCTTINQCLSALLQLNESPLFADKTTKN